MLRPDTIFTHNNSHRAVAKWLTVHGFCTLALRAMHLYGILIAVDLCVAPGEEVLEAARSK